MGEDRWRTFFFSSLFFPKVYSLFREKEGMTRSKYILRGEGGRRGVGGEDFFRIIFDDLFAGNAGRRGIFFFGYIRLTSVPEILVLNSIFVYRACNYVN